MARDHYGRPSGRGSLLRRLTSLTKRPLSSPAAACTSLPSASMPSAPASSLVAPDSMALVAAQKAQAAHTTPAAPRPGKAARTGRKARTAPSLKAAPTTGVTGLTARPVAGRPAPRGSEADRDHGLVLPTAASGAPLLVQVAVRFPGLDGRPDDDGPVYTQAYAASSDLAVTDRLCAALLRRLTLGSTELITRKDSEALRRRPQQSPHQQPRPPPKPLRYALRFRILCDDALCADKTFRSYQRSPLSPADARAVVLATHRMVGLFLRRHDPSFRWTDVPASIPAPLEPLDRDPSADEPPDPGRRDQSGPLSCVPSAHFLDDVQSFAFVPGYSVSLTFRSRCRGRKQYEWKRAVRVASAQNAPLNLALAENLLWQAYESVDGTLTARREAFLQEHAACDWLDGAGGSGCQHFDEDALDIELRVENKLGPAFRHLRRTIRSNLTLFRQPDALDCEAFLQGARASLQSARDAADARLAALPDLDLRVLGLRGPAHLAVDYPARFVLGTGTSYSRDTVEALLDRVQTGVADVLRHRACTVRLVAYKRGHLVFNKSLVAHTPPVQPCLFPAAAAAAAMAPGAQNPDAIVACLKERICQDLRAVCQDTCSVGGGSEGNERTRTRQSASLLSCPVPFGDTIVFDDAAAAEDEPTLPAPRVVELPDGVDLGEVPPPTPTPSMRRRAFPLVPDKFVIPSRSPSREVTEQARPEAASPVEEVVVQALENQAEEPEPEQKRELLAEEPEQPPESVDAPTEPADDVVEMAAEQPMEVPSQLLDDESTDEPATAVDQPTQQSIERFLEPIEEFPEPAEEATELAQAVAAEQPTENPAESVVSIEPQTAEPELAEPELAEPELAKPKLAEPELAEPELAEPELVGLVEPVQLKAIEPVHSTEPESVEPKLVEPETVELVDSVELEPIGPVKSAAPEPVEPQPAEPQPVEPQPVELESVDPQPVELEPVEHKPVELEPVELELVEPVELVAPETAELVESVKLEPTEPAKSAETEPVEPRPVELESVEPQPVELKPDEHEPVEHELVEPVELVVPETAELVESVKLEPIGPVKSAEPETVEPQPTEPQPVELESVEPRSVEPVESVELVEPFEESAEEEPAELSANLEDKQAAGQLVEQMEQPVEPAEPTEGVEETANNLVEEFVEELVELPAEPATEPATERSDEQTSEPLVEQTEQPIESAEQAVEAPVEDEQAIEVAEQLTTDRIELSAESAEQPVEQLKTVNHPAEHLPRELEPAFEAQHVFQPEPAFASGFHFAPGPVPSLQYRPFADTSLGAMLADDEEDTDCTVELPSYGQGWPVSSPTPTPTAPVETNNAPVDEPALVDEGAIDSAFRSTAGSSPTDNAFSWSAYEAPQELSRSGDGPSPWRFGQDNQTDRDDHDHDHDHDGADTSALTAVSSNNTRPSTPSLSVSSGGFNSPETSFLETPNVSRDDRARLVACFGCDDGGEMGFRRGYDAHTDADADTDAGSEMEADTNDGARKFPPSISAEPPSTWARTPVSMPLSMPMSVPALRPGLSFDDFATTKPSLDLDEDVADAVDILVDEESESLAEENDTPIDTPFGMDNSGVGPAEFLVEADMPSNAENTEREVDAPLGVDMPMPTVDNAPNVDTGPADCLPEQVASELSVTEEAPAVPSEVCMALEEDAPDVPDNMTADLVDTKPALEPTAMPLDEVHLDEPEVVAEAVAEPDAMETALCATEAVREVQDQGSERLPVQEEQPDALAVLSVDEPEPVCDASTVLMGHEMEQPKQMEQPEQITELVEPEAEAPPLDEQPVQAAGPVEQPDEQPDVAELLEKQPQLEPEDDADGRRDSIDSMDGVEVEPPAKGKGKRVSWALPTAGLLGLDETRLVKAGLRSALTGSHAFDNVAFEKRKHRRRPAVASQSVEAIEPVKAAEPAEPVKSAEAKDAAAVEPDTATANPALAEDGMLPRVVMVFASVALLSQMVNRSALG